MNTTATTLSLLLLGGAVVAQSQRREPPRPEAQLSTNVQTTSIAGFNAWRVESPRGALPADPARGLAATERVVYAVWVDEDANRDIVIRFLRSTDGGFSWDQGQTVDILTASFFNFEQIEAQGIDLVSDGHSVFVAVPFNRDTQGASQRDDYAWVLGSNDQGQTWQSVIVSDGIDRPLATLDRLADVDEITVAAGGGRAHVIFSADYRNAVGLGGASSLSDVYYQAVEFDAAGTLVKVFAEERRLDVANPSGSVKSYRPAIACEGNTVAITWQDDRLSTQNGAYRPSANFVNTYCRVSTDRGATLTAEHDCTAFTTSLPLIRPSFPVVDEPNVYVIQEDHRFGAVDQVYLSFSNDRGRSWTDDVRVSKTPNLIDSDNVYAWADGGSLIVTYADDRNGPGNSDNDIYLVRDDNAGADFAAGNHTEYLAVDNSGNDQIFGIEVVGDTIALVGEFVEAGGEGCGYAVSQDGGRTWTTFMCEDGVGEDVDDPRIAMTDNLDIVMIWQDDAGRGNNFNDVYVRGMHLPVLVDNTATRGGLVSEFNGAVTGMQLALLIPSLTPPTSNGFPLDFSNSSDLLLNFSPDALTLAAFGQLALFTTVSQADGSTSWPYPNFARFINQPVYYVVFWIDAVSFGSLNKFTDPIEQR